MLYLFYCSIQLIICAEGYDFKGNESTHNNGLWDIKQWPKDMTLREMAWVES